MQRDLPDETSYKVEIREFNGNLLDYILKAEKIERYYDRKLLNAFGVSIVSYDADGKIKSTMLADSTTVDDTRNMIYASGKVVLSSENGKIEAPRLVWDRAMDEIMAPDRVILTREDNVLRGYRMRTDSTISYAEMESVSAEGSIKAGEFDW